MLVGVKIVEVIRLLAELNALRSITELLNKKRIVLLHDLPNQLAWNSRHLCYYLSLC
ncbi:hypothetical protein Hanom_Chr10g00944591 [Helianthus anomalus]